MVGWPKVLYAHCALTIASGLVFLWFVAVVSTIVGMVSSVKFDELLGGFLWSWVKANRPFILHREGHDNHDDLPEWAKRCNGDPVPW